MPQYGENMEASIHNSIGGFLLPNAESLVGSDHISGEFYPMLASGWELSNNARTWTINLRQDIPWHGDNGDFSSADVIHSLERAVDPEVSVFSYIARFPQLDGTPGSIRVSRLLTTTPFGSKSTSLMFACSRHWPAAKACS